MDRTKNEITIHVFAPHCVRAAQVAVEPYDEESEDFRVYEGTEEEIVADARETISVELEVRRLNRHRGSALSFYYRAACNILDHLGYERE